MFDRLFKNKKIEMRMVPDSVIWRGPPEEEPTSSQPTKLPIYWDLALETIVREGSKNVACAFIAYKTATTLLRMAEHIVVTKVK